jgi:phospholipase D1/2
LDLTKGRLDWGDHHLFPSDKPNGTGFTDSISYTRAGPHVFDDYYSAEFFPDDDSENGGNLKNLDITLPRQPWHDIHAQLTGATAWDVIREFVGRWNLDPSSSDAMGDDSNADIKLILDKFLDLFNHKVDGQETRLFLQQWEHGSGPWNAQVYRSMVKEHWGSPSPVTTPARTKTRKEFEWAVSGTVERSIQEAYEKAIGQAERFIYIETQYLIGSGNLWGRGTVANPLPQLIADRIVARHQAKEPFHAYIVVPMFPEGDPSSPANGAQRQFQWTTMRAMIRRVQAGVGAKWEDHLSFYFLANWKDRPGGIVNKGKRRDRVRANERYMVYVHSKMMIIDDRYVILGSANLNERSLNGVRDSEICIGMWPASDKVAATCVKQVQAFREGIWKEHLGSNVPSSFKDPESPTCITVVQKTADDNYKQFRNGKAPANGHLCRWPIDPDAGFPMKQVSSAPEGDSFLPDGEDQKAIWRWDAPGKHSVFPLGDLTKPGQDIAE